MNGLISLALFVIIAIFSACDKEDDIEAAGSDYLIFGYSYGACAGGGCVGTYMLTDKKLFEDVNDNYAGNGPFDFVELENDKYLNVKDLMDFIPPKLLTIKDTIFGCPDCGDWGGLYIEYKKDGNVKKWQIDQKKANVPDYLHGFMDKVNEKIGLIHNKK